MEKIGSITEADPYILSLEPKNTLLLFDIDDTLLRSQQHGGRWHAKLLGEYVRKNPEHVKIIHDAKKIMSPGMAILPEFEMFSQMRRYLERGYKVMIVTARPKQFSTVTYQQLSQLYDINGLYGKELYKETPTHLLKYGIVFTGGHDKGKAIRSLLQIIGQGKGFMPTKAVFIDNSLHECENVSREFVGTPMKVFHYLGAEDLSKRAVIR